MGARGGRSGAAGRAQPGRVHPLLLRPAGRARDADGAADRGAHQQPRGARVVPPHVRGGRGGGRHHRRVRVHVVPARAAGDRGACYFEVGPLLTCARAAVTLDGRMYAVRQETASRRCQTPGTMRIRMSLNYAGGFAETVEELADYEKAGLEIVFVPEAYSFDAVSQLGFIAAKTQRLQIASGIFQLYSRTPALTAMTAAGLDYGSGGRFTLGSGASGPQVIEGWHGVPYDAPVGRTRG